MPPNSAATFFFDLMLGDRPRATGASRRSHAGSATVAGGSYGLSKNGSLERAGSRPAARDDGDVVQRRAQRFGHELQAIEVADGSEHVRAVGALAPPRLEQSFLARRVQHPGQQPVHGRVAQQPIAELAQYAAIKAWVGQVKRQQVLPVDPSTHGFRCLPVAQPFAELHERHQREPPRRIGRLPALGVEISEVGIRE